MTSSPIKNALERLLNAEFAPLQLMIEDISHHHKGHAAWRAGEESHFSITLVSQHFANHTLLQRQRMVHNSLADILPRIHALTLTLKTPSED